MGRRVGSMGYIPRRDLLRISSPDTVILDGDDARDLKHGTRVHCEAPLANLTTPPPPSPHPSLLCTNQIMVKMTVKTLSNQIFHVEVEATATVWAAWLCCCTQRVRQRVRVMVRVRVRVMWKWRRGRVMLCHVVS
jgi:hypothetical protein